MPVASADDQSSVLQVLVIEDDADSRELLCRLARRQGFAAQGVGSVREALAKLAERPSNVIVDLTLSDGTGLAVLERISNEHLPIDVAVVTGTANGELLADAVLMRPDALFIKPYDLAEVVAWLSACRLRLSRGLPRDTSVAPFGNDSTTASHAG